MGSDLSSVERFARSKLVLRWSAVEPTADRQLLALLTRSCGPENNVMRWWAESENDAGTRRGMMHDVVAGNMHLRAAPEEILASLVAQSRDRRSRMTRGACRESYFAED